MSSDPLSSLNQQLQVLALTAQNHPPLSKAHQAALRQLVSAILNSGRLCRPQKGLFSGAYEDIYAEAQQDLLLYICKNINQYSPERATVMTWVNMLLAKRFFREAIPKVLGPPNVRRIALADLESVAEPEEPTTLLDCIREVVAADPENLFKSIHIREHPEATFQALFQRRLSNQQWHDIATEFGISLSTAQTFFSRCLQRFLPYLREHCSDISR
ncbi:MAG: sigma-70 family RNA polymerase sigma factor [Phormidesmis sp. RL_2_1]|nr:sigma-70 family RNA polymerase sigma factor [Phormidesmis sp. RL_2_1]